MSSRSPAATATSTPPAAATTTNLLSPLTIRGVTLRNRIAMSPMCQYVAVDGLASDWHLVHLGSRASGGTGLVMVEATAVTAEGRISPGDMGIWGEQHVEPLARIARFVASQGATPAIQLAHAGRKASCQVPWLGGAQLKANEGGWQTIAPSPIPFHDTDNPPRELDQRGIDEVIEAFAQATQRALRAGFQLIELHAAHGYLLNEFLSPLTNRRTDQYGGSLENRIRLVCQVVERMRQIMPAEMPLFVRISATDWVEGGWDVRQSVELARALKPLGVDLIDVSSGAIVPNAHIPVAAGYQVPLARQIRAEAQIMTGAVGLITQTADANEIVTSGAADLVLIGRELLRDPYWALHAQQELGGEQTWPISYGYAVARRRK